MTLPSQALIPKKTLTETDIETIKQLATACEAAEQLHMRIDWTMLSSRTGIATNDFLYYVDDQLVGYLALDDRGTKANELIGMVHPAYRRQGIFYALLTEARKECRQRSIDYLILICERTAYSGHGFLHTIGARYSEYEHEMVLTHEPDHWSFDDRLVIHQADLSEAECIVKVSSASFEQPIDVTQRRVLSCFLDAWRIYYLAVFGDEEVGCREPVGSFRLDAMGDVIGIYAFCVHPDYQGRGYGRQMLQEAIRLIREQGSSTIILDVEVQNARAVNLYRSCGFDIRTTYDYYIIDVRD